MVKIGRGWKVWKPVFDPSSIFRHFASSLFASNCHVPLPLAPDIALLLPLSGLPLLPAFSPLLAGSPEFWTSEGMVSMTHPSFF